MTASAEHVHGNIHGHETTTIVMRRPKWYKQRTLAYRATCDCGFSAIFWTAGQAGRSLAGHADWGPLLDVINQR